MKIMWMSNAAWAKTGYGVQTNLLVKRFRDMLGHQPAIFAYYGLEGAVLNVDGIPVYSRAFHLYGADVAHTHTLHFGAKVLITLMDVWVLDPKKFTESGIWWIPYFPIDHEPCPPIVLEKVKQAKKRIAMSKFGVKMLEEAGLDCYYAPHCVDTKTYIPIDMTEARKRTGLPQDAFIIGIVAANKGNPSRKAFVQQIEAFAKLKKLHSDAYLYLHTTTGEAGEYEGINLPEVLRFYGLTPEKDYNFCNQYHNLLGYGDQVMTLLYSSMDVFSLVSMGEGFGIPIIEAQSCGVPVVVGDWTAMSELCFSGWKVPKSEADAWFTPLSALQFSPRSDAILECYKQAYEMRGNIDYRKRARESMKKYDVDYVVEKHWRSILDDIQKLVEDDQKN